MPSYYMSEVVVAYSKHDMPSSQCRCILLTTLFPPQTTILILFFSAGLTSSPHIDCI